MKKILYIIGVAVATIFTSCQKDADVEDNPSGDRAVAFSAESIVPLTKVSGTSWEAGDAIGITVINEDGGCDYDNVKYTTASDGTAVSFTTVDEVICYPEDGSAIDFKAYYPYQEGWSYEDGTMIWNLSEQDGTAEAQSGIDLLESAISDKSEGDVEFVFTHALSKVQITVRNYVGEYLAFDNLYNLSATLCTYRAQYNIITGAVVSSEDTKGLKMVESSNNGSTAVFTAIIAPGAVTNDEVIFTDGITYYAATLAISSAEAGKQYNFTAEVGEQGFRDMVLTSDGIEVWDAQDDVTLDKDIELVGDTYQIYSAAGLKAFADWVNSGNISLDAKLMNDIDLEGSETNQWTPIGNQEYSYGGTFDGGGFKVSGLYISDDTMDYVGFFGYASSASISNLGVAGSVEGDEYVGGVVGLAAYTSIINCYNIATVSAGAYVGGLVGANQGGTIYNSYNLGGVVGSSSDIGGLVGIHSGTSAEIKNCYTSATVAAPIDSSSAGFAVGTCDGATITSCYYDSSKDGALNAIGSDNNGQSVTAYASLGDLLGYLNSSASDIDNAATWVEGSDSYPTLSF